MSLAAPSPRPICRVAHEWRCPFRALSPERQAAIRAANEKDAVEGRALARALEARMEAAVIPRRRW